MGALRIAIGTYWHDLFARFLGPVLVIVCFCQAYVSYVWWKQ
ncbi:MAG: hypothetical protein ACYCVL_15140 [Gemmatimonadaceae bacterium]